MLKKVLLLKLEDGKISLFPLEDIKNCTSIDTDEKTAFWIYDKPLGMNVLGNDEHLVHELNAEHVETILKNGGACFVETNYSNELKMAKNPLGNQRVIIHFARKQDFSDVRTEGMKMLERVTWNFFSNVNLVTGAPLTVQGYQVVAKALCGKNAITFE